MRYGEAFKKVTKDISESDLTGGNASRTAASAQRKAASAPRALNRVIDDLKTMCRMLGAISRGEYSEYNASSALMLLGGLVYFVVPTDAICDLVPVVGYIDDLAVLKFVIGRTSNELVAYRSWELSRGSGLLGFLRRLGSEIRRRMP